MCSYGSYHGISNVTQSVIPSLAAYDPQNRKVDSLTTAVLLFLGITCILGLLFGTRGHMSLSLINTLNQTESVILTFII